MGDGIQQAGQKIAEQFAEQMAEKQQGQTDKVADAGEVARFEEAMQGSTPDKAAVEPQNVSKVQEVSDNRGIGDSILEGMEKLKGTREEKEQAINELLSKQGDTMSTQDAMRLQHELMQLHLQTEMTTKAADKSSQGVQTLFKNQ